MHNDVSSHKTFQPIIVAVVKMAAYHFFPSYMQDRSWTASRNGSKGL